MAQMQIVDKNGLMRVGTALHEVLVNAIEHGNLEVSSELREDCRTPTRTGTSRNAVAARLRTGTGAST